MRIHCNRIVVIGLVITVICELTLGHLPAAIPGVSNFDTRWGLILPLITTELIVSMQYSGLKPFEKSSSVLNQDMRLIWFITLLIVDCLPALFVVDNLSVAASLRNRILIYALASLCALIMPVALSILPVTIYLLLSLLFKGAQLNLFITNMLTDNYVTPTQVICACALVLFVLTLYTRHGSRIN